MQNSILTRNLAPLIKRDLDQKIVLLSGARQCGKTTLSKMLLEKYEYLNYDLEDHRTRIERKEWDRKKSLIIFDELHKKTKWKSWLKGIYDVEGVPPSILVTGSARLDTYRKVGDSLAGRHFTFRLHPLDLKELKSNQNNFDLNPAFKTLIEIGGFPEPYFNGSKSYYSRWRRTHLDIILKQDLILIENVQNIMGIENLIRLLRTRVGSTVSYANLARDLQVDPKTVKNWLEILENLYVIFKVTPYSKKIKDSLLKAPKYYFFDNGQVEGNSGVKLENLVACALIKELHFLQDTQGSDVHLHYLRTKHGDEVDFLVVIDRKAISMIEVKWRDQKFSQSLFQFDKYFPQIQKLQLVGECQQEKTLNHNTELRSAAEWLSGFQLK